MIYRLELFVTLGGGSADKTFRFMFISPENYLFF